MPITNKKISVVVPCRNEQDNILAMHERLTNTLQKIAADYEIIYTDNGSIDNSEKIFRELAAKDQKVSVIFFSRNFGSSDIGMTAGSEYASGDAVVWIDGDQQDPPELIEQLAEKWLAGFDVVYGLRTKRQGNFLLIAAYKLFYRLYKKISYLDIPLDAGDFSLMDRKVINAINSMPERNRFMRGLRTWAGFKHTGIEYVRQDRQAGTTKINFWQYIRIAKRGLLAFSYAPLEWISFIAGIMVIISFFALLFYTIGYFFVEHGQRGISTIIVLTIFLGSIQLLSLSVIGEYLAKIFEEVKQRPKYLIREILNDHRKNNF